MAADLHIHVRSKGLTDEMLRVFNGTWICGGPDDNSDEMEPARDEVFRRCPAVWVGEVSWIKAWLFEDDDTFIPGPIEKIQALIGDAGDKVIDEALIDAVREAFGVPNDTGYPLAIADDVCAFLSAHKGEKAFCVSH